MFDENLGRVTKAKPKAAPKSKVKISPLILPAINALLWGGFAWIGLDVGKGTDLGQVEWYVVFPLVMVIVSLVPSALLSQTKWAYIGNLWSLLTLIPFFPFFCGSLGGGV